MSAIAVAELTISAPIDLAFARFIDFATWDLWMPKGFRPITGPSRELREGDRFKMSIGPGLPSALKVIRLRPGKEICWGGGVPYVLTGEHSFFFEAEGDKTHMRSEEPFTGLLAHGPFARALEREGGKVGLHTMQGFAAYLARS